MKKIQNISKKYWFLKNLKIYRNRRKANKRRQRRYNIIAANGLDAYNNYRTHYRKTITNQAILPHRFPENCSFLQNPDVLSTEINTILDKIRKNNVSALNFDLSNVQSLDTSTIVILLTLANYLNIRGIKVYGNMPINPESRKLMIESDFFSHVKTNQDVDRRGKDKIFTKGDSSTDQDVVADQILSIVEHLTGQPNIFKPLYTLLGEIQLNSVEHSNKNSSAQNWFMAVHYEDEKCQIAMADIGRGIIHTLRLLFHQEVMKNIRKLTHSDILLKLFQGEYQSSTKEPNRNNGLPDIFTIVQNNIIDNLFVITNKAYIDLSGNFAKNLNVNFPGTFYVIEVSKKNVEAWLTTQIV